LPEDPQNPRSRLYLAVVLLRDFAASRANRPGTRLPEDPYFSREAAFFDVEEREEKE
jgi:hypothetical protein